jgi:hypothetical protein
VRAISTKSLEEQWHLLGTLKTLNRMLFGLTTTLSVRHGSDLRGGATTLVFFVFKRT